MATNISKYTPMFKTMTTNIAKGWPHISCMWVVYKCWKIIIYCISFQFTNIFSLNCYQLFVNPKSSKKVHIYFECRLFHLLEEINCWKFGCRGFEHSMMIIVRSCSVVAPYSGTFTHSSPNKIFHRLTFAYFVHSIKKSTTQPPRKCLSTLIIEW